MDDTGEGKLKYSEKKCPNATLSTTNLTWIVLGSNPSFCDERPATDRQFEGVRLKLVYIICKMSVRTSQRTVFISTAKRSQCWSGK
jgi:hypothetical protein